MQNKEIVVAYKREPILIISLVMLMMKCLRMFLESKGVIHEQTLWLQKVVLNVSLQKEFTKLDGLPHAFPKM